MPARAVAREIDCMQQLVENTLQLAWQDAERAPMNLEPIQLQALWDMLAEDACYESGWPPERLRCELPVQCWVQSNLNHLAQALENMLRNAIRHSPEHGLVRLGGYREGNYWRLSLEDQGRRGRGGSGSDLRAVLPPRWLPTRGWRLRPGAEHCSQCDSAPRWHVVGRKWQARATPVHAFAGACGVGSRGRSARSGLDRYELIACSYSDYRLRDMASKGLPV